MISRKAFLPRYFKAAGVMGGVILFMCLLIVIIWGVITFAQSFPSATFILFLISIVLLGPLAWIEK